METIKKILIPTDFSQLSYSALQFVTSTSAFRDATIYVMHVIDNDPALAFHTVDLNSETILRDVEEKAKKSLGKFIREITKIGVKPSLVVRRGDPHKEIIKFAKEKDVDLIALATHGRTGLAHMLIGSIAEKVVRYSPVPVLTVKPQLIREPLLREHDVEKQLHISQNDINLK